jgi:hypothetical protein
MGEVPTQEDVSRWSPEDRARVARSLDACIDRPFTPRRPPRQRRVVIAIAVVSAVVLLPWVGLLSVTLQETSSGGAWRTAWVGFDFALFVGFACTGWLVWRRRQIAVVAATATASLLLTDAWFDLTLSWNTPEFTSAILTAVLIELPLTIVLIVAVFRMLRLNALIVHQLRGQPVAHVRLRDEMVLMYPASLP